MGKGFRKKMETRGKSDRSRTISRFDSDVALQACMDLCLARNLHPYCA